jgi:hypothetical protein
VSVTVSVPEVAALPVLLTASVYVPVEPAVKFPGWDFASASTALPESVVGSVAPGVLGAPPPDAVTEFVTSPGGPTALTVNAIGLPVATAAMAVVLVQVAICAEPLHVQPVPLAALKVRPAGIVSVTVIVPLVAAVPLLLTAIVYVPVAPIVKFPVCDFAIASVGLRIVVGSVAVGVLVAPPPEAAALFVNVAGAFAATLTVRAIDEPPAPAAMTAALVQVTTAPASTHAQPVPDAALNVSPVGRSSLTVSVPDVATLPGLLTASVYVPVEPAVKLPLCDFAIARTGAPFTVVGSTATGVLPAPPPDAVTEFVSDPGGPATLTVNAIEAPAAPAAMAVVLVQVAL